MWSRCLIALLLGVLVFQSYVWIFSTADVPAYVLVRY